MADAADPTPGLRVVPYSKELGRLRRSFNCGVESLNAYLRSQASQDQQKRASALFMAVTGDGKALAGFYTLAMYSVEVGLIPETLRGKLPRYPLVPCILLGRLAVDLRFQGNGLGELLLVDAMKRAMNNDVAWWALVVHAKEGARSFYLRYGFLPFHDSPDHLFLPYSTIRQASQS